MGHRVKHAEYQRCDFFDLLLDERPMDSAFTRQEKNDLSSSKLEIFTVRKALRVN